MSFDVSPKVAIAVTTFYRLLYCRTYDEVYRRPLRSVTIHEAARQKFAEPVIMDGYQKYEPRRVPKPVALLEQFIIDRYSWHAAELDPNKSDHRTFDGESNWFVTLWHNHKNWSLAPTTGTFTVGVSIVPDQPARVNSFCLKFHRGSEYGLGHPLIILPRGRVQ